MLSDCFDLELIHENCVKHAYIKIVLFDLIASDVENV